MRLEGIRRAVYGFPRGVSCLNGIYDDPSALKLVLSIYSIEHDPGVFSIADPDPDLTSPRFVDTQGLLECYKVQRFLRVSASALAVRYNGAMADFSQWAREVVSWNVRFYEGPTTESTEQVCSCLGIMLVSNLTYECRASTI